jgi:hypothetical protein
MTLGMISWGSWHVKPMLRRSLLLFILPMLVSSCEPAIAVGPTHSKPTPEAPHATSPSQHSLLNSPEPTFPPTQQNSTNLLSLEDVPPGVYLAYCAFGEGDLARNPDAWPSLFIADPGGHSLGRLTYENCGPSDIVPNLSLIAMQEYPLGPAGLPSIELINPLDHSTRWLKDSEGCAFPSWSSDGRKIAVSCDLDIYVIDIASNEHVLLADCVQEGTSCTDPRWAPDGRGILVFKGIEFHPNWGIYYIDSECIADPGNCKGKQTPLIRGAPPFAWSPSAERIAFSTPSNHLGIASASGQLLKEIPLPKNGNITSLAWSPDELLLAVTLDTFSDGQDSYLLTTTEWRWNRLPLSNGVSEIQFWMHVH